MGRRFRALALVAVVGLVASACGGDGGGEGEGEGARNLSGTTITFSTALAEEEKAGVQQVLDAFQEQTGARVNLTSIESGDLPQKLKVDVQAGKPTVHIFGQDNLALNVLVEEGLVQEVGDVPIPDEVKEAMIPQEFDGQSYFLPYRPNVRVAYINRDRFEAAGVQPPTTVEEFRAMAEKFKAESGGQPKVTLSLAEGSSTGVVVSEWVVSFGGDPLVLNDEGSVEAFEFMQGMWQDQLLARESLQAQFDTEIDNLRGEIAYYAQNWPFTSAVLADEGLLEKFDVHEGWAGPERAAHVIGGEVLGIPEGVSGRQKEAAVALAEFLMGQEAQQTLAATNGWPSIRNDAYAEVPEEQQETFDAVQAALEDGWYRPNVPYWADAEEAMNEAVRRILQQGEPVKPVLDELHDKIASAAEKTGAEYPPSE